MKKKLISIVTPCYNEEENIEAIYKAVKKQMEQLGNYRYEQIVIDNASTDNTVAIVKKIARKDRNVKLIVNARNFGHIRSPYYGLLQASGDAAILMASDFQDPPSVIPTFIEKWEEGYKIVAGVKNKSKENWLMFRLRKMYYNFLRKVSEGVTPLKNFTGFGLYDKQVLDNLRTFDEPYPFFRGLIAELGFHICPVEFEQPRREKGKTKNNFYTLYDMAMLGVVNHSKVPLRMAAFIGFGAAFISLLVALGYLLYKIFNWDAFDVGIAPLVIGLFFFSSVQLIFIGIQGEYSAAIYTYVKKRPLVIEKERINFGTSTKKKK